MTLPSCACENLTVQHACDTLTLAFEHVRISIAVALTHACDALTLEHARDVLTPAFMRH